MTQQRTIFKLFFSFEKEEKWLESMSAQGWHLQKTPGLVYTFHKGEQEDRLYKIDFHYFKNQDDQQEYITLFEDSGWYSVLPKRSDTNFYFYTRNDGSQKDIFSDEASRIQRYLRYARNLAITFFFTCIPYAGLLASGTLRLGKITYLTPGLWEMQGWNFVRHFLFETPFALFRFVGSSLPLIILAIGLYYVIRAYAAYRRYSKA